MRYFVTFVVVVDTEQDADKAEIDKLARQTISDLEMESVNQEVENTGLDFEWKRNQ